MNALIEQYREKLNSTFEFLPLKNTDFEKTDLKKKKTTLTHSVTNDLRKMLMNTFQYRPSIACKLKQDQEYDYQSTATKFDLLND